MHYLTISLIKTRYRLAQNDSLKKLANISTATHTYTYNANV